MAAQPQIHISAMTEYTDRDNKKRTRWTRVGVAFENRDGSFNIELDALPVSGRLQMRKETADEATDRERRAAERRRSRDFERGDVGPDRGRDGGDGGRRR